MYDIVFIILNYNLYDEVINCVDSIERNIDTNDYHIIVVDNFSPNNAGKQLSSYFSTNRCVSVLLNVDNLGFAKGNNCGIAYARQNYPSNFICCLNNDTLLEQKNFFSSLKECYKRSEAAVIGPKIILRNGSLQPICGNLLSMNEYEKQLMNLQEKKSKKGILKKYLLKNKFIFKCNKIRHNIFANNNSEIYSPNVEYKNIILHGCCLIFTPKFFTYKDGFNPRTFMFREEELLFLSLQRENLTTLYAPCLQIRHLEDLSTDSVHKNTAEKEKFLRDNQIKSLKILIDELKR